MLATIGKIAGVRAARKAKSSADFGEAAAKLEADLETAKARLAELEAERENVVFGGGSIEDHNKALLETRELVETLKASIQGAHRRRDEALERERHQSFEAEAEQIQDQVPGIEQEWRKLHAALVTVVDAGQKIREHGERVSEFNLRARAAMRTDLLADTGIRERVSGVMNDTKFKLPHPENTDEPTLPELNAQTRARDVAYRKDPFRVWGHRALDFIREVALGHDAHTGAKNDVLVDFSTHVVNGQHVQKTNVQGGGPATAPGDYKNPFVTSTPRTRAEG